MAELAEREREVATAPSGPPQGVPATGFCLHSISKAFAGVQALADVSFDIQRGEVHALIGQNGAGKSTLMKIFSGAQTQDSGEIWLDGDRAVIADPMAARRHGIAIVHQEFALCPNLTVAENVFLGKEPTHSNGVTVDHGRMRAETERLLGRVHVDLAPDARLAELGVSEWQVVEICKALADDPSFIVMDEPTAALTDKRADELLAVVAKLRESGLGIIYISHKLSEVLRIADRVTVLRDGGVVESRPNDALDEAALVRGMTGTSLANQYPEARSGTGSSALLTVEGLTRAGAFSDISFTLHRGEILGLTGIVGAGGGKLIRSLFGIEPADSGTVYEAGRPVRLQRPADAIRIGLGFAPADRKAESLLQAFSVYQNATMAILGKLVRWGGLFRYGEERRVTRELIQRLDIKVADPAAPIAQLSGGNQQKVSIAKWLEKDCQALLLEEPTRGIDVQAKAQVWKILKELADQGLAVLVVSTELQELLHGCDRLLVMRSGRIVGEYSYDEFDEEAISVRAASEA